MSNQITIQFGKTVKRLRTGCGLSQEKFALSIGLDRTYIASLESGKRNVSLFNISLIAHGLGLTMEQFFHEMERMEG